MDDGIKQRLIGAVVLVALMVIFLPMFFEDKQLEPADILIDMPEKPPVPAFEITRPVKPSEQLAAQPQAPEDPAENSEQPADSTAAQAQQPVMDNALDEAAEKRQQVLAEKRFDENSLPVSWTLQVASFQQQANAEKLRDRLRSAGYKAYLRLRSDMEPPMVRVFVGPVLERKAIEDIRQAISKQYQLEGVIVRYLP